MSPLDDPKLDLRCGHSITGAQHESIGKVLNDIIRHVPARFVLLVDVSGQVVASALASQTMAGDNLVALGALVAGDLAASQEIARLTGEYGEFQMVIREGKRTNLFITEAGRYLALLVQVENAIPLGWARMLIHKATLDVAGIADAPSAPAEISLAQELGPAALSGLIDSALDGMWMEETDVR